MLQKVCGALKTERDRLYTELQSISYLEPYPSESNFILSSVIGRDAGELKDSLAKKYGIMVRHYTKKGLSHFIRISAGKPEQTDILLKALRELEGVRARALSTSKKRPPGPAGRILPAGAIVRTRRADKYEERVYWVEGTTEVQGLLKIQAEYYGTGGYSISTRYIRVSGAVPGRRKYEGCQMGKPLVAREYEDRSGDRSGDRNGDKYTNGDIHRKTETSIQTGSSPCRVLGVAEWAYRLRTVAPMSLPRDGESTDEWRKPGKGGKTGKGVRARKGRKGWNGSRAGGLASRRALGTGAGTRP